MADGCSKREEGYRQLIIVIQLPRSFSEYLVQCQIVVLEEVVCHTKGMTSLEVAELAR